MLACMHGDEVCVEALLRSRASVHTADHEGWTPLHLAADHGHGSCVGVLLEARADACAADSDGMNALMLACMHGHEECVGLLVAAPACAAAIDKRSLEGQTALMLACEQGHTDRESSRLPRAPQLLAALAALELCRRRCPTHARQSRAPMPLAHRVEYLQCILQPLHRASV